MKVQILTFFTAVGLLFSTATYAQDTKSASTDKPRRSTEEIARNYSKRMAGKLKLDKEQTLRLEQLCLSHMNEQRMQREKCRDGHREMTRRLQEILTPEQYAQWKEGKCRIPGHKTQCGTHHRKHHKAQCHDGNRRQQCSAHADRHHGKQCCDGNRRCGKTAPETCRR